MSLKLLLFARRLSDAQSLKGPDMDNLLITGNRSLKVKKLFKKQFFTEKGPQINLTKITSDPQQKCLNHTQSPTKGNHHRRNVGVRGHLKGQGHRVHHVKGTIITKEQFKKSMGGKDCQTISYRLQNGLHEMLTHY